MTDFGNGSIAVGIILGVVLTLIGGALYVTRDSRFAYIISVAGAILIIISVTIACFYGG